MGGIKNSKLVQFARLIMSWHMLMNLEDIGQHQVLHRVIRTRCLAILSSIIQALPKCITIVIHETHMTTNSMGVKYILRAVIAKRNTHWMNGKKLAKTTTKVVHGKRICQVMKR